jgi:hypothetical protein
MSGDLLDGSLKQVGWRFRQLHWFAGVCLSLSSRNLPEVLGD